LSGFDEIMIMSMTFRRCMWLLCRSYALQCRIFRGSKMYRNLWTTFKQAAAGYRWQKKFLMT